MRKIFLTLIITIILILWTNSVFALTETDKETILGYIATRQNSITYNYGDELFENIENFNYVLFGTGYHNNQTNIVLTNVIPNTNSTTFSSIENLKTLQYGTTVDYASIYNITSTPTVKLSSSTSRGYGVEASTTFSLKPTNGYYGILNSPLLNDDASNREVILEGGQPYFNFMSTYWDYEENTLRVYLGRQYNSDFSFENNKPTSITISLYDVRGVLSSQRIYNCDYTSSDYHENTNSFHIKLDKNDFYSSNTDVYLKIIVGVSSGTNWYERWYTLPIDWNQEAGTGGETPPSGGSSNITGTGTGTSTGTVDENGNVNIDNNIDIDLDTTPITDNMDKNTQEIINKLEEEPTTTDDDFKNNFVDTEIEDPSDDFFTWIFDNLENIFLSTEEQTLEFSLYTDNVYEISTNQITVPDGILKTLVGLSCDFGICYWILRDVRKTINKVKEGSIENLADEDITANMV